MKDTETLESPIDTDDLRLSRTESNHDHSLTYLEGLERNEYLNCASTEFVVAHAVHAVCRAMCFVCLHWHSLVVYNADNPLRRLGLIGIHLVDRTVHSHLGILSPSIAKAVSCPCTYLVTHFSRNVKNVNIRCPGCCGLVPKLWVVLQRESKNLDVSTRCMCHAELLH